VTAEVWRFLTSPEALAVVEQSLPKTVDAGQRISAILPSDVPEGFRLLCRLEAHPGTGGRRSLADVVTPFGAITWNGGHEVYGKADRYTPPYRFYRRLCYVIPRIAHWRITEQDYRDLPQTEPEDTVYVDPPYANAAGRVYAHGGLDYAALAEWCRARRGTVIVCEQIGATWLPFAPLRPTRRGWNVATRRSNLGEAVWVR
jgi:hypothetical protein